MTQHEMILTLVNKSIQKLSKKIKHRYPKLSWQIAYNQDSDQQVRCEECFSMQVGFNDQELGILDLNVQLDDNSNLRIDVGLVQDEQLFEQLKSKNILTEIRQLFADHNKVDHSNGATRLSTLLNFKKSNIQSIKANIKVIMDPIEMAFMMVMSELRTT